MSKFRDDTRSQREDIGAFFRSPAGLIVGAVIILFGAGGLIWNIVADVISQVSAG